MQKFYFVGDLHLNDTNPRSRVDDYPTTILNKLEYVFEKAEKNNIEAIFFLGDIFHKPGSLSTKYLNRVVETFQKSTKPCYTIIGNHDIPFSKVDEVDNTSLGILFKSKALIHLDKYDINDKVVVYGYDYGNDISFIEKPDLDKKAICLSHSYGEDVSFGVVDKPEYFKWSQYNEHPFDVYILGHDHSYHETRKVYDQSTLYRLGALSRITSALSDTGRKIKILELSVDGDVLQFNSVDVPYEEPEKCFSTQSLSKDHKVVDIDFNNSLEDILSNLNFSITSSIFDIIDEMDLDEKIVNTIELYLKNNFIIRKEPKKDISDKEIL